MKKEEGESSSCDGILCDLRQGPMARKARKQPNWTCRTEIRQFRDGLGWRYSLIGVIEDCLMCATVRQPLPVSHTPLRSANSYGDNNHQKYDLHNLVAARSRAAARHTITEAAATLSPANCCPQSSLAACTVDQQCGEAHRRTDGNEALHWRGVSWHLCSAGEPLYFKSPSSATMRRDADTHHLRLDKRELTSDPQVHARMARTIRPSSSYTTLSQCARPPSSS